MIRNSRFAKVAISAGLIVVSGAAVLGITSFASAKVATNRAAQVQVSESAVPLANAATQASSSDADRPKPIATAATALGVSESDLVAQLTAGKSIADVAKAQGVDIDKVITALTDAFKAHLDAEVKSGEHTQDEADAKLAKFTTRVTTMVNTAGLPPMRDGRGGHGARFATENLAKVLKLSVTELNTQLQSGKSLTDIANAQKVDIADVKDVLVSDFKAHLDTEVKSGEHTQAEADAKLAEFKTRLDDMVNRTRPAGGPGMDGHGSRGGHGAPFAMDNLAKALKMTVAELNTELQSGKSLADIAEAQNVEVNSLKSPMVADFKLHLAKEVESGEHTQAEADAKLAKYEASLDSRFDDMVNGVRPARGPGMDGRGGHRGHGGPGHRGGRDGFPPSGNDTTDPQAQDTSLSA